MTKQTPWFEVDRDGLREIVERRGSKSLLVQELISNAWDEPGVTTVEVKLEPENGKPLVHLTVTDDAPEGFKDLSHAWTLFARSAKRGNADMRGRFNLGEKLVLAFCTEASIHTTCGSVIFDHRGRTKGRSKREVGSEFYGLARMTRAELDQVRADLRLLIPPPGITTAIDGEILTTREPLAVFEACLWTEMQDEESEGALARRLRFSEVRVFTPRAGEVPMLYELGIPVVKLDGDPLHIDVRQKVPLNLERENVTPSYLRDLRLEVAKHCHTKLSREALTGAWATEAIGHYSADAATVKAVVTARFGDNAAIADPSDREAEHRLVGQGTKIVHGGALPADAWSNIRKHGTIRSAGQISPTPKPYSADGDALNIVEPKSYAQRYGLRRYHAAAHALLERPITILLADEPGWGTLAVWHQKKDLMVLNVGKLSDGHFADDAAIYAMVIHEVAHEVEGNHLSESYHDELCRLGARLAILVGSGEVARLLEVYSAEPVQPPYVVVPPDPTADLPF